MRRLFLVAVFLAAFFSQAAAGDDATPSFALAEKYEGDIELADYWASEKYDGIRAYWDGEKLISRNGNAFAAPDWFVAGFPSAHLDGELWLSRGRFEETSSIVTRDAPHEGWRKIKFMVFDLPAAGGDFDSRLIQLRTIIGAAQSEFLFVVPQEKISGEEELLKKLEEITSGGGEGLMLRRAASLHKSGRSNDLLKVKKFDDGDAVVIGHNPGKGKYRGLLGSVTVKTAAGVIFRIGSGFTDAMRANPPPLGATITFKHYGFFQSGKPRFAVFWRLRADSPE
jgi:DNA ligase-1